MNYFLIITYLTCFFTMANNKKTLASQVSLQYKITITEPHKHYATVEIKVKNLPNLQKVQFKMPVWTPGSYMVREFSKNVVSFQAHNPDGKPTTYKKTDKNTWEIFSNEPLQTIKVTYTLYLFEPTVRTSFIDEQHATLNPSSVFMYLQGFENEPIEIEIVKPSTWQNITTALPTATNTTNANSAIFLASNYDILADSPIEIGNHELHQFTAAGVPHTLAICGVGNHNAEAMISDLQKIINTQANLFGGHPCTNYVFFQHNTANLYGGLEHLNSTILMFPRWDFKPFDKYVKWLGLASHEYFHLWNVKRIRPIELGPFDYNTENYTHLLWLAEGFTNYYDDLFLQRAGLISTEKYLELLVANVNDLETKAGKHTQSVADASFDAWIKYYRPNENSGNTTISYYTKGALVAMLLDLQIIENTNTQKSLDDVMRTLYNDFYVQKKRGFTSAEAKEIIEAVAQKDLNVFFSEYINGTTNLNYNQYLQYAGAKLEPLPAPTTDIFTGITTETTNGKYTIKTLDQNGCAYNSDLNVGDEILAINEFRVSTDAELETIMRLFNPAQKVTFLVSRQGILLKKEVTLATNPTLKYKILLLDEKKITPKQMLVRKKWLQQ